MSVPVLELRGLSASFPSGQGRRTLFTDVDLTVGGGETAAILGRSGSGKTTLLTLLGLMQRPEHGTITLAGRDVSSLSDADAARLRNRHIGFVFQNYSLIPHLSVLDNVLVPATYAPRDVSSGRRARVRRRAEELLDAVGLGGRGQDLPLRLSGGEQQRVAIARALLLEPAVVLADEPTGALDEQTGARVLDMLVATARHEGRCLVVVTHDDAVAGAMDRVFRLGEGTLREEDRP